MTVSLVLRIRPEPVQSSIGERYAKGMEMS